MNDEILFQLEALLGYSFRNKSLLRKALTHSSCAEDRIASNERLEFLGDSILSMIICRRLYEHFPEYLEGDLTKIKSMLVSRRTCAQLAEKLDLQKFAVVGKGMSRTKAMSGSIIAGAFEAVIAAIYLDGGLKAAEEFVLSMFRELIDVADAQQHQENFKSLLQQYSQQKSGITPVYELLDERGPDHNKCFEVSVVIGTRRFGSAWGMTKKDAEQKAAYNALVAMDVISVGQK